MGGPSAPKPTQQERELQASQARLLEVQRQSLEEERAFRQAQVERELRLLPQQEEAQRQALALQQQQIEGIRRQELLQDTLYQSLGLEKQVDEQGRVTGYVKTRETPEEQLTKAFSQFQTAQIERQKEQDRLQDLLYPSLLESQGYRLTRDASGRVSGVEQTEEAKEEAGQRRLTRERTTKALKGELEVDPALTKQLGDEEVALRESLRKQLGGDYATSTPGIEALSQFNERKQRVLYGARRGEITLGEQLQLSQTERARGGAQGAASLGQLGLRNIATANIGQGDVLRSLYGRSGGGTVGSTGGGGIGAPGAATFSDVFGGGQALLGDLRQERQNQYASAVQRHRQRQATGSTIGSIAGGVIGAFTPVGVQGGAAIGGAAGYGLGSI